MDLCWAMLDWKINHIFSYIEGGYVGPPPENVKPIKQEKPSQVIF